jgi:hypothetical protein
MKVGKIQFSVGQIWVALVLFSMLLQFPLPAISPRFENASHGNQKLAENSDEVQEPKKMLKISTTKTQQ